MTHPLTLARSIAFGAIWSALFLPYFGVFKPLVGAETSFGAYLLLGLCIFGTLHIGAGALRLVAGVALGVMTLVIGSVVTGMVPLALGAAGAVGALRLLIGTGNRLSSLGHFAFEMVGVGGILIFALLAEGMAGYLGYVFVIWSFFLVEALMWRLVEAPKDLGNQGRFDAARRMAIRIMEEG